MRNQISSNRVHPNHDQRKRPLAVSLFLNNPSERRQRQKTNPPAKQCPTRRPNPLNHRANPRHMQQRSCSDSYNSRQQQLSKRNLRRLRAQPSPRNQSQNHRAQRRNKTQSQISTLVEYKRLHSWKNIQEPLVESISEIRILVPMSHQSAVVMRPICRHAHRLPIESRPRGGIKRPSQPIAE